VQLGEHHGTLQVELRTPEPGGGEVDPVERGAPQVGAAQVGVAQVGPVEPAVAQHRSGQVRHRQVGLAQVEAGEVERAENGAAHRHAAPLPASGWEDRARASCLALRDACLAWRDGAEVVATARAFGLGGRAPYDELVGVLTGGGIDDELAATVARTLLHYVLGHAMDEQLQRQAGSAGALHTDADDPLARDHTADVTTGVDLVLTGLRARLLRARRRRPRRAARRA